VKAGTTGEARVQINAPPEKVYALVTDVTRMGEWSPETVRCVWLDGATGPSVGARFKGTNRRGIIRWSTKPKVAAAEPGQGFAFIVAFGGRDLTKWTYRFEPTADGQTMATESLELRRDLPWYFQLTNRMMGAKDRKADLELGMQKTLNRIKSVAEGSA
jgi:uncharacterized protein YndB with AHSA1/START domain